MSGFLISTMYRKITKNYIFVRVKYNKLCYSVMNVNNCHTYLKFKKVIKNSKPICNENYEKLMIKF